MPKRKDVSSSAQPPNKRFKPYHHHKRPTDAPNLSALKKRHRDLSRTLKHKADLPADIAIANERELRSLQHDIDSIIQARERKKQISKYHMVRFFERQRAERNLKRARRRLKSTLDASVGVGGSEAEKRVVEGLEKEVKDCEVDLMYTRYFPLVQNYVSLYPREARKKGEGRTRESGKAVDDGEESDIEEEVVDATNGQDMLRKANGQEQAQARSPDQPNRSHLVWGIVQKALHDTGQLNRLRDGPAQLDEDQTQPSGVAHSQLDEKAYMKPGTSTDKGPSEMRSNRRERNGRRKDAETNKESEDSDGFFET